MANKPPFPFIYRFLFLYLEPISALLGTIINILDPLRYLQSLSPAATASSYSPLTKPIYDQLAAHLLFFSWSQAVVLRSTNDMKVWKALLFGMFLCDILHLFASYRILGPEVFFNPTFWRWEDWVNFIMLYGPGGLRLAFCAGVGVRKGELKTPKIL